MNQLNFFETSKSKPTGEILRDQGIRKAIQHSEDVCPGWNQKALDFLYLYALKHDRFSGEMVRIEAKGIVPEPASLRTWGSVLLAGAKRGWIRRVGTVHVTNPKAHCCFATEWESLIG